MTGAVAERVLPLFRDSHIKLGSAGTQRATPGSDGGRLTLEQRLDGVWEGLTAGGVAECPLCRGRMSPAPGGAVHDSARCGDCGTTIA